MDLTPRPVEAAPVRRRRRGLVPGAVLSVALGGGAVLVFANLSAATMYFCNADEVGVRSECSGDKRFRLQGTVVTGSVQEGAPLRFAVEYGRVTIPVTYAGRPGGIFREGIPVVVEGRQEPDGTFAGTNILVKHTEQYRADHSDRTKDYSSSAS
ncbi:MAG: cytochrome c maturation protein CcmE [Acidimicrobiales bacterium]